MQNSTLDSSFVNRLKQILASRYGKGLQIRQLMDLSELSSEEIVTRGRDLHIPIRVNGAVLGTAVVPSVDDLDSENKQNVAQLVRMVLEPAMYRWYLDQKEANLIELSKANLSLDNVLLFGEEAMPSIDDILEEHAELLAESPASELVSHLIHLEGHSANNNKKIALQLHEMTNRWAFVPFDDIKGQLHSSDDIARLGAMSIFVENIEALKGPEQELLLEYIEEEHSSEEPLIITSSLQSIEQMTSAGNLSSNMIDELSVNCFEVDRAPLTSQGLKEVLELFFLKNSSLNSQ